ncbi:MAG: alcohol dehydrogenase catalytic domain-containing protein, partial [Candidatus Bathyarchaeia archaeon]
MGFTKHMALTLKEYGKPLVVEEVVTPAPRGEEVLLKTLSVGICHSDIHVWKGEHPWPLPMVLGHEVIGTVVAKGDKVPESLKIGETYLLYFGVYKEEDKYSRRGLTQHAKTWRAWQGGLQEYFLVPHYRFLVSVDGLEDIPASAPLGCAALTAYGAVKKIRYVVEPDEYVAIIGLGGLGLFALQWVKIFIPQANIIGIDIREDALRFANSI